MLYLFLKILISNLYIWLNLFIDGDLKREFLCFCNYETFLYLLFHKLCKRLSLKCFTLIENVCITTIKKC